MNTPDSPTATLPLATEIFEANKAYLLLQKGNSMFLQYILKPNYAFVMYHLQNQYSDQYHSKLKDADQYVNYIFETIKEDIITGVIEQTSALSTDLLLSLVRLTVDNIPPTPSCPEGILLLKISQEGLTEQTNKVYQRFFDQYFPYLNDLLQKKFTSLPEADTTSALLDSFVLLWQKLNNNSQPNANNLLAYLYQGTSWRCLRLLKKYQQHQEISKEISPNTPFEQYVTFINPDSSDMPETELLLAKLESAMQQLGTKQADCVDMLRYWAEGRPITKYPTPEGPKDKSKRKHDCLKYLKKIFFDQNPPLIA